MNENIKVLLILIVVGAVDAYALWLLHGNPTRENYFLFSIVLLFFLVIYCVSVLQYRITGSTVGVEKAIQQINTSKEEISKVAENLVKMAAVIADGSSRYGGMPKAHQQQIEKYKEALQVQGYLKPGLGKEIQETIHSLDLQIENENKESK